MGAGLVFDGEFYNLVGVGVFTPYQLEKTRHFDLNMYEWRVHCSDGDRRVPRYSADRVEIIAETPKRCIIYVEDASHTGELIQGTTSLTALTTVLASPYSAHLISEVQGHVEPKEFDDLTYASVTFDCPVAIEVFDSAGERIAWYDPDNQTGHGLQGIAYYRIEDTTIVLLSGNVKVTLRLRGTDEGEANIELNLFEGGTVTDNQILERVSVGPRTIANMDYNASSLLSPVLEVDFDGDGVVDSYLTAKRGNTPLGVDVSVTLADGRVVVTFKGVHSAGNTVCQSVESLEGIDPALKPVTTFYWLSTSALFSGSASITIQYDEANVPTGRESDLKLYRITGEETIEDITQQLDQAANTVTGQTDSFSYFVIGYMSASPETSILSPTTGDTVTGQSCRIDWQATDPDNQASSLSIDLFYSTNGGSTWTSISSDEANDGVYHWNISALRGGEYWLKVVATDPEEGTSEAIAGPFTISVFEGNIIVGPNPVTNTGAVFFYALPEGTSTAKLMILSLSGRLLFETVLDVDSTRFPSAGTWNPVDQDGIPLANGPYIYVLIANGKVIGQGKMVIQRRLKE